MKQVKDISVKKVIEGIDGYYTHGEKLSLGMVEIAAGTTMPVHHHEHEQISYMLEGQLNMECGGVSYSLTPGSVLLIPSNTPHGAYAVTDCKLIDVFSPVREDYK